MTFRLTAAMCEPISDERIPKLLTGVADMMSFLFAVVMVCGLDVHNPVWNSSYLRIGVLYE